MKFRGACIRRCKGRLFESNIPLCHCRTCWASIYAPHERTVCPQRSGSDPNSSRCSEGLLPAAAGQAESLLYDTLMPPQPGPQNRPEVSDGRQSGGRRGGPSAARAGAAAAAGGHGRSAGRGGGGTAPGPSPGPAPAPPLPAAGSVGPDWRSSPEVCGAAGAGPCGCCGCCWARRVSAGGGGAPGRCPGGRGRLRSAGEGAGASPPPPPPWAARGGPGAPPTAPPGASLAALPSPPRAGRDAHGGGAACASRPLRPSGRARGGPGPSGGERGRSGARRMERAAGPGRRWGRAPLGRTGRRRRRRAEGAEAPAVHPGAGPLLLCEAAPGPGRPWRVRGPSGGGPAAGNGQAKLGSCLALLGVRKGDFILLHTHLYRNSFSPPRSAYACQNRRVDDVLCSFAAGVNYFCNMILAGAFPDSVSSLAACCCVCFRITPWRWSDDIQCVKLRLSSSNYFLFFSFKSICCHEELVGFTASMVKVRVWCEWVGRRRRVRGLALFWNYTTADFDCDIDKSLEV